VVAAGAAIWLDGDAIADARVGLAAVGPNTTRIAGISDALRGRTPDEDAFAEAGRLAAAGCSPITDARGSEDYKRHLADELTRRTLRTAAARAAGDRTA
jgi:carbon-monoxide dehydrogenase medium subunit